jgi:hypothetical protein
MKGKLSPKEKEDGIESLSHYDYDCTGIVDVQVFQ